MALRRSFAIMGLVNWLRLTVFFVILIFGLIVMGLTAHFAEILVPSDLTRFVTVGLIVSIITLIVTTTIFLLGIFRTYIYAAQTRIELAWLGLLTVLWMALAVFLSMSADVEIDCADAGGAIQENQSVGMTSDEFEAEYRAMQACSFINAIFLAAWFLLLLSFALAHHFSGYDHVWRTPVADYGWFENRLGARQRRKAMDDKVKRALGGISSESSFSTEEEIRGRSNNRNRVRERDRDAIREKAGLPVALFRPFYELPRQTARRPTPVRAVTQPIQPVFAPVRRPVPPPLTIPLQSMSRGPSLSRATTPVRPGPPVRTVSTPQPARQPTPPPATPLSRNVSAKSAQTFMTARSTQSARTPMAAQLARTPTTTAPQRPRTPVNAAPRPRTPVNIAPRPRTPVNTAPRPRTPVNAAQPSRPPVTPTQPRTPVVAPQPVRAPTQPVRTASQSNVPQRTTSQSAQPTRPIAVRTASTPLPARPAQPTAAPPSRLPQPPPPSRAPRPSPIVTSSTAPRPAQGPATPLTARSPPTANPVRSQSATGLARTPTPVRGNGATAGRQPVTPSAARPQPVRTASTPQATAAAPTPTRPSVSRSQTTAAAIAKVSTQSPVSPVRPGASRSQTYWQPPPSKGATLNVPAPVGKDGLRNRSRSPAGRMV